MFVQCYVNDILKFSCFSAYLQRRIDEKGTSHKTQNTNFFFAIVGMFFQPANVFLSGTENGFVLLFIWIASRCESLYRHRNLSFALISLLLLLFNIDFDMKSLIRLQFPMSSGTQMRIRVNFSQWHHIVLTSSLID